MNISDTIIQLAKENNGVITSAAITEKGISRGFFLMKQLYFCGT